MLVFLFQLGTLVYPNPSLFALTLNYFFVNNFHFNLFVMFVYFVNQSSAKKLNLNEATHFIILG
jgi:hypothetical protein